MSLHTPNVVLEVSLSFTNCYPVQNINRSGTPILKCFKKCTQTPTDQIQPICPNTASILVIRLNSNYGCITAAFYFKYCSPLRTRNHDNDMGNLGLFRKNGLKVCVNPFMGCNAIFFPKVYSSYFILTFFHLCRFEGWGFGVWVLNRVFGVVVFSWWGLGPVVWSLLSFLGLGLFM